MTMVDHQAMVSVVQGRLSRVSSQTYESAVLSTRPENLKLFILANETSGTVAADRSGEANDGAFSNVILANTPGPGGRDVAPYFDGTGYINLYSAGFASDFSGQELTVTFWMKVAPGWWASGPIRNPLTLLHTSNNRLLFDKSNNQLRFLYTANGTGKLLSAAMSDPNWIFVAASISLSNDRMRYYINGRQVSDTLTGLGAHNNGLASANTLFGGFETGSPPLSPWLGWGYGIAYWNAELEPFEILRLYEKTVGAPSAVNRATAQHAALPLTTPTYDGSGEGVHPDVYDAGEGNAWNGYRYWMAFTPYENANETLENPSILASNDGTNWEVPDGLTNPIAPNPGGGVYNSDPDLLVDGDGVMWCYYRETNDSTYDRIYVTSSTDGVTWSAATQVLNVGFRGALSPAVVYDGSQYVMYVVNASSSTHILQRYTCATPDGTFTDGAVLTVNKPTHQNLWHLDVVKDGDEWHALVQCVGTTGHLYYATSPDGLVWTLGTCPVLQGGVGAPSWASRYVYRGTLVKTVSGFDVWYTGVQGTAPEIWRIGRTSMVFI